MQHRLPVSTTCTLAGCFCRIAICNMSQPTKLDIHFHLSSHLCHIASCDMSQPTMLDICFCCMQRFASLVAAKKNQCHCSIPGAWRNLLCAGNCPRTITLVSNITCRPRCRMHLLSCLHQVRVPAEMSSGSSISGALCVHSVGKDFMLAGMSHEFVPRCRFHFLCTIAIAKFHWRLMTIFVHFIPGCWRNFISFVKNTLTFPFSKERSSKEASLQHMLGTNTLGHLLP